MTKKKTEQLESREDTINRGKSNCCRITMAEDALKRQRARLDCLENGHKWEYKVVSRVVSQNYNYVFNGATCSTVASAAYEETIPTAVRACTVCGKTEEIRLPDRLLKKIKKLFK